MALSPGSGAMLDSLGLADGRRCTADEEIRQFLRVWVEILEMLNRRSARVFLNAMTRLAKAFCGFYPVY